MERPQARNGSLGASYKLLPFRFTRFDGRTLLVNQGGQFLLLPDDEFERFVDGTQDTSGEAFLDLKAKHFLADGKTDLPVEMLATKYRTKKGFLRAFTSLHMLVLTVRCNQKCKYCQVACTKADARRYDMQPETARKAVELIFESPSPDIKIEFQGGEPFLNFDVMRAVVGHAEELNKSAGKHLEFVACTNLTLVTRDQLKFCRDHGICISTSLDGPEDLHNLCRSMEDGEGSYRHVMRGIEAARDVLGHEYVAALMTATRHSLGRFTEVVDEYLRNGFRSVFFRSLNPYGWAVSRRGEVGYPVEDFVRSYREGVDYILGLNLAGESFIEDYASILLTRMLTPFGTGFVDLQSPTGAGIECAIYDYDGNVYVSDEGRMLGRKGDKTFLMGNVYEHDHRTLFSGNVIRQTVEASCVEGLPQCSDCAFNLWCGADPVRNYATQGRFVVHKPSDDFCVKNQEIIRYLLDKAVNGDENVQDALWSWVTRRPIEAVRSFQYGGQLCVN
jgi:His-Xaa-Ser system radical SAM maturase HxsB